MNPGTVIREAREAAGITQATLASRLGTTQPAIARLERDGVSPTVETMSRTLRALQLDLVLTTRPRKSGVDESLIRIHLALSPTDRLRSLEAMQHEAAALQAAGARIRGPRS